MTIQPLSTADMFSSESTSTGTSTSSSTSSSTTSTSSSTASVSENEFLTLLVAQLKNQDPMNPADSTQFVAELAQFSQLQEVIGVHQDLDSLLTANGITTA